MADPKNHTPPNNFPDNAHPIPTSDLTCFSFSKTCFGIRKKMFKNRIPNHSINFRRNHENQISERYHSLEMGIGLYNSSKAFKVSFERLDAILTGSLCVFVRFPCFLHDISAPGSCSRFWNACTLSAYHRVKSEPGPKEIGEWIRVTFEIGSQKPALYSCAFIRFFAFRFFCKIPEKSLFL